MTTSALPALAASATALRGARWTYAYYFTARAETD